MEATVHSVLSQARSPALGRGVLLAIGAGYWCFSLLLGDRSLPLIWAPALLQAELEETEGVNGQPRQSTAKGLAWLCEAKRKLSHWSRLYTDEKENAQSDK